MFLNTEGFYLTLDLIKNIYIQQIKFYTLLEHLVRQVPKLF